MFGLSLLFLINLLKGVAVFDLVGNLVLILFFSKSILISSSFNNLLRFSLFILLLYILFFGSVFVWFAFFSLAFSLIYIRDISLSSFVFHFL